MRFALATAITTVVCKNCQSKLRPTEESAHLVAKTMFMPSARVGVVLGAVGTWYGLSTGRWMPLCVVLGIGVGVSFAISWWLATKRIEFERA